MDKNIQKTIAVVEDDEQLLFLINKKLSINNLKTILAPSKKAFFEYLQIPNKPKIDLFWLDFYLGDGDAFELIDAIKKIPMYQKTPIIIVSNSIDENRVKYMLSLGVKKYFLKASSSLQELLEEVVQYTKSV